VPVRSLLLWVRGRLRPRARRAQGRVACGKAPPALPSPGRPRPGSGAV